MFILHEPFCFQNLLQRYDFILICASIVFCCYQCKELLPLFADYKKYSYLCSVLFKAWNFAQSLLELPPRKKERAVLSTYKNRAQFICAGFP